METTSVRRPESDKLTTVFCFFCVIAPMQFARADERPHVSKSIVESLRAAQADIVATNYGSAINRLKRIENNADLSALDHKMIYDFESFSYLKMREYKGAKQAYEAELETGICSKEETDKINRLLVVLNTDNPGAHFTQATQESSVSPKTTTASNQESTTATSTTETGPSTAGGELPASVQQVFANANAYTQRALEGAQQQRETLGTSQLSNSVSSFGPASQAYAGNSGSDAQQVPAAAPQGISPQKQAGEPVNSQTGERCISVRSLGWERSAASCDLPQYVAGRSSEGCYDLIARYEVSNSCAVKIDVSYKFPVSKYHLGSTITLQPGATRKIPQWPDGSKMGGQSDGRLEYNSSFSN